MTRFSPPLRVLFSAAIIATTCLSAAIIWGPAQGNADTGMNAKETTQETIGEAIPVTGRYCVSNGPGFRLLGLRENEDNSLDFGASIWFDGGQHCGMIGTAQPNPDGGWRYEEKMDSPEEYEHCRLDITDNGDAITLNADQKAGCRMYCGGGVMIYNIVFPKESQESKRASPGLFDAERLVNTRCQPQQPHP